MKEKKEKKKVGTKKVKQAHEVTFKLMVTSKDLKRMYKEAKEGKGRVAMFENGRMSEGGPIFY